MDSKKQTQGRDIKFRSILRKPSGETYRIDFDVKDPSDESQESLGANILLASWLQFTGLKDKNGKGIYEGDILRYSDGNEQSTHQIYWEELTGRWFDKRLEDGDSQTSYDGFEFVTDCKVIGNIYENSELLKS